MPRPASRIFDFEPKHIEAMQRAFGAVCAKLELSTGTGVQVAELVARKIIELARAGEHDADRLTARVLAEFGFDNDGSLWRH
jgi:predicted Zn-dependent protease